MNNSPIVHNGNLVNPINALAKRHELNNLEPYTDTNIDVFDLSIKEDFEKYREIFKLKGHKKVTIFEEQKHFVEETKNWKVFIKWGTIFLDDKNRKAKSVNVQPNGTVNYRQI